MCVRDRSHTSEGYLIPLDYLLVQVLYFYTKPVDGTLGQSMSCSEKRTSFPGEVSQLLTFLHLLMFTKKQWGITY
jgi:hypothetical protein